MTHIDVHFNVADPRLHACRLLVKGMRLGSRLSLVAPAAVLDDVDRLLWTHDVGSFIPHFRLTDRADDAARMAAQLSPIWLMEDAAQAQPGQVLVNLGMALPQGFERVGRLIDIVGSDEEARVAGRLRWKHYRERGYEIKRTEIAA